LLEGVNLPAKNIILYNPKAGDFLNRLSILNLAGRAGRLLKDYYGKIYCINIKDWELKEEIFDDKLEEVKSSSEIVLTEESDNLVKYLKDDNYSCLSRVEGLATSLIIKYLTYSNTEFLYKYKEKYEKISLDALVQIEQLIKEICTNFEGLDKEIILKNKSVDPRFQYRLYNEIMRKKTVIVLPSPEKYKNESKSYYDIIYPVFNDIYKYLLKKEDNGYRYFSWLASVWLMETSYKSILENKISRGELRANESEKAFINRMIEDLDDNIESDLKYEFSKGLKCYIDIANYCMSKIGYETTICKELPTLLEAGACSKRTLFLMEAGFSRTSAIKISEIMEEDKETISEYISWIQNNMTLLKEKIPNILYEEIKNVIDTNQVRIDL